jgi:hypothetical protein
MATKDASTSKLLNLFTSNTKNSPKKSLISLGLQIRHLQHTTHNCRARPLKRSTPAVNIRLLLMPLPGCFLPTEHKTPQKRKNKTKSPLQNKFNYVNCKPLLVAVVGSRSSTSAVARSSSADRPSPHKRRQGTSAEDKPTRERRKREEQGNHQRR